MNVEHSGNIDQLHNTDAGLHRRSIFKMQIMLHDNVTDLIQLFYFKKHGKL